MDAAGFAVHQLRRAHDFAAQGVTDGLIAGIGPELAGPATEEIDASGLHLLPGVLDAHVHMNEPGRADWEGFDTGTRALAAGTRCLLLDEPTAALERSAVQRLFERIRQLRAAGVAIMQPALPPLTQKWLPDRVGFATAVYSNGLLIGEIVPTALTIPFVLPLVADSWRLAFVVWAVPTALIAVVVAALAPRSPEPGESASGRRWWLRQKPCGHADDGRR